MVFFIKECRLKEQSLKKNSDFKKVYGKAKGQVCPFFVLYGLKNDVGHHRIGFTVSKKIGNAVVRNKVRRRLKECFKDISLPSSTNYDFVIVARSRAKYARFATMKKIMNDYMGKYK